MSKYHTKIGLEVHAQITRASHKLFSPGLTKFGQPPNSTVSLFDTALPGTLPLTNLHCVKQAVRAGLALRGDIQSHSRFVRKHYFYQDLPLGYQITQQAAPIVLNGSLGGVSLLRIQLEQDSGKSLHDLSPSSTFVDLNRAGTALLELVTAPDLRSAEDACVFVYKLQRLLQFLQVSDGRMDEGSLRVDVNVSLHKRDIDGNVLLDGERVEIKNLNTLRGLIKAVDYEEKRQIEMMERGESVLRETRSWDAVGGCTKRLRGKEEMLDYRFMDDPDLPELVLDEKWVEGLRKGLPELPEQVVERFTELGLSGDEVGVLMDRFESVGYFDELFRSCCQALGNLEQAKSQKLAKMCCNKIINELFGRLRLNSSSNSNSNSISSSSDSLRNIPLKAEQLTELIVLEYSGQISGRNAKELMDYLMKGGKGDVKELVRQRGLLKETREEVLRGPCEKVVMDFSDEVEEYRQGRERRLNFLVGQVLKQFKGRADPDLVKSLILEFIECKPTQEK